MRMHLVARLVGLCWLCLPAVTFAQSSSPQEGDAAKAAVRFQQGVELYREGNFEGALAEFRKAYQLSPSYRVLYNVAQAQYALHDFVGAYRSLLQYLADGGTDIGTDRRAQVDEMSAKLAERIGHLQIAINVGGADIRVDDVSVGTSPLPGPVPVNVGSRRITAVKAGFIAAGRVATVAGRETLKIELHLDEPGSAAAPGRVPSYAGSHGASASGNGGAAATLSASASPATGSGHTGLVVSLTTTAVLAAATGACAYLALAAQKDLENQIDTYPNTKARIDDARAKSRTYGYVTDALGAATLVSGGVALYFALTHRADTPAPKTAKSTTVVLAPTLGGAVLQGRF